MRAELGALLLLAPLCTGCALGSLVKLATGQLEIVNTQVGLERAVVRERDPERRFLLAQVPAAKRFAEEALGLPAGKSYAGYFATEREGMTYVLTASERLQLRAYAWWFPIAGRVEYRSYRDAQEADDAAAELEARGYDTWVSPSRAYSTLGYFRDPISTTMLRDGLPGLIEVLFHELAHARLYVPGDTEWNEALATFVGELGAEQYFARASFAGTRWRNEMRERSARRRAVDDRVAHAYRALERLYASGRPRAQIEAQRLRVFEELTRAILRVRPNDEPAKWRMNNARLVHLGRYSANSERFVRMWRASRGSWTQFWRLAKADSARARARAR